MELSQIGRKIFLDRYAQKGNRETLTAGDLVMVLVKPDPKWPQVEEAKVVEVNNEFVDVELMTGEEVGCIKTFPIGRVDKLIESEPEQVWERVSLGLSNGNDDLYHDVKWATSNGYFVPAGRILTAAGTEQRLTYFNCNVLPMVKDSRSGIVDTLRNMIELMSRGGGVGINISSLRPQYAPVLGVNGRSSGAVSWGGLYSFATGLVSQGGCFAGDTRIATDKGLIPASELLARLKDGETIAALTHKGNKRLTWYFDNGVKPVYRVTTASGYTVDVTADHQMGILLDGQIKTKALKDLSVGDTLLVSLSTGVDADYVQLMPVVYERSIMSTTLNENIQLPTILDENLAYWLGYSYGNGYVQMAKKKDWEAPKAIAFSVPDSRQEIKDKLTFLTNKLFGLDVTCSQQKDSASTTVYVFSRMLIEWLRQNKLLKEKAADIRVPEAIFRSPSMVMGAFIAGYFDSDGSDRKHKGGYGFDSVSREMLTDVQQLLAANGIVSHIDTQKRDGNWQDIHRLIVTGPVFKRRLSELMFPYSLKDTKTPTKRDRTIAYSRDTWDALNIPRRYCQGIWSRSAERISYGALSRIGDRLKGDGQVALAERVDQLLNVVPDTIVSIESVGEANVYDFEVADIHMLSGNGIYTSNSRRGALLLLLSDWHPDIEAFIDAKKTAGKMENANLSVGISTQFEQALVNDDWWTLEFPDTTHSAYDTDWNGDLWDWKDKGLPTVMYKQMRARELWRKITGSAWASAEPGVVRLGYDNAMSNSWYFNKLICVNPCLTGDTLIYTSNGLQRMDDLYFKGNSVTVMADSRLTEEPHLLSSRVFMTGIKPVFKLITQEGYEVRLTKDHKVMTNKGWVEAGNLTNGDKIYIQDGLGGYGVKGNYDVGKILGWLIGDGHLTKERAVLSFYDVKRDLASSFVEAVNSEIRESLSNNKSAVAIVDVDERDESTISSVRLKELVEQYGITASDKLQVPESVFEGTQEMQKGFLQALFSADGHVETYDGSRNVVVLSSVSAKLLKDVQKLLLNFGIYSHIYRDRKKAGIRSLPDGRGGYKEYECKAVHDLRITNRSIFKFKEQIGFLLEYKQSKLEQLLSSYVRGPYQEEFTATFVELIPDGEEPVYDITVPHIHAFAANGLVVHNCGEQPLSPWGVCNLGHINLGRMVNGTDVDWDTLKKTIHIAVQALDSVIDVTPYFFDEQKEQAQKERRIGLGTLGLAELLVRLGMANDGQVPPDAFRYGSKRCLAFVDKLYRFIAEEAYKASVSLAIRYGSFPAFDADKFLESGFMKTMSSDIRELIREHGIRNVTLLTQAPTGSVGTMMGTSTGIEPFFSWMYYRNSRLGLIEVLENVANEWLSSHVGKTLHDLPPYFVTAMELTPEEHIRMQAAIQKYTDAAISKTVNMPKDATIEDVDRAYRLMIELGIKGGTIYRDGSRDEQVLTASVEPTPSSKANSLPMEEDIVNDCPNGMCSL